MVFDRFEGLTFAVNPLRGYFGSSGVGPFCSRMTMNSTKGEAGEMILYSASLSMFGAKVQIALIEKRIDYQLVMVPYDRERGYEPRHPEVLRSIRSGRCRS